MDAYEKAALFMRRCARPLDFARWRYHLEGGSAGEVMTLLSAYQNADGGFGHALEPDNFNPNSTPMGTWAATEVLREIGWRDASHPLIQGLLRYLDSGADFDEAHRQWLNTVPSNNDHPCAIWWKHGENGSEFSYNPTAALAGFVLRFAEPGSRLYERCFALAGEAAAWLLGREPFAEKHVAACFVRLYEDCLALDAAPFDRDALLNRLRAMVRLCLDGVEAKWDREYVAFPSDLIFSPDSPFLEDNRAAVAAECASIPAHQLEDGSFPVTWTWCNDHREWPVAEVWCKTALTLQHMRFLRMFGGDPT